MCAACIVRMCTEVKDWGDTTSPSIERERESLWCVFVQSALPLSMGENGVDLCVCCMWCVCVYTEVKDHLVEWSVGRHYIAIDQTYVRKSACVFVLLSLSLYLCVVASHQVSFSVTHTERASEEEKEDRCILCMCV